MGCIIKILHEAKQVCDIKNAHETLMAHVMNTKREVSMTHIPSLKCEVLAEKQEAYILKPKCEAPERPMYPTRSQWLTFPSAKPTPLTQGVWLVSSLCGGPKPLASLLLRLRPVLTNKGLML